MKRNLIPISKEEILNADIGSVFLAFSGTSFKGCFIKIEDNKAVFTFYKNYRVYVTISSSMILEQHTNCFYDKKLLTKKQKEFVKHQGIRINIINNINCIYQQPEKLKLSRLSIICKQR